MNSDGGKASRFSQDGRAFDGSGERCLLCGTRLELYILIFLLFGAGWTLHEGYDL